MDNIKLRRVKESCHWNKLKELNKKILRVNYDDNFYDTMKIKSNQYAFVMDGEDGDVGTFSFEVDGDTAYVFTFGIVQPLRGVGIGWRMWMMAEDLLKTMHSCKKVMLHVQRSNMEAIRFYKRQGFNLVELIEDYYENLVCNAAYLIIKSI